MATTTREVRPRNADDFVPLQAAELQGGSDLDPLAPGDYRAPDPFESPETIDETEPGIVTSQNDRLDNLFFAEDLDEESVRVQTDASKIRTSGVPKREGIKGDKADSSLVREAADKVLRTLTGISLDDLQPSQLVQNDLKSKIGLRILDPVGNISEELIRAEAVRLGTPPEVIEKVIPLVTLAAGIMFPPGGAGKFKKALTAANLSDEATKTVGGFQKFLREGRYVVLTAENPGAKALSAEENAARMKSLMADLRKKGFKPVKAEGHYGGLPENSVVVPGMTVKEGLALGKKYGQESILTPHGLVYVNDSSVNPANLGKIDFSGTQEDYFTKLKVAGQDVKFTVPIDFETKVPLSQAVVERAGGKFIGETPEGIWFNEPKSGSTALLKLDEFSEDAVEASLARIRESFGFKTQQQIRAKLPTTSRALELAKKGRGGATWYHGVPEELHTHFGEDWELVADLMALASPGIRVEVANRVALDAYFMHKAGRPVDDIISTLKVPGVTGPNIKKFIRARLEGKAVEDIIESEDALKVVNFARALKGDRNAVVVDRWMIRIFYPDEYEAAKAAFEAGRRRSPDISIKAARYRLIEQWVQANSGRLGLDPADFQAAMWVGAKIEAGDTGGLGMMRELIRTELRKRGDTGTQLMFPGLNEDGNVRLGLVLALGRAAIGAVAGGAIGDTTEERIQNALFGLGLGAAASPALVRRIASVVREGWREATPATRAAIAGGAENTGVIDAAGAVNIGEGTGRLAVRRLTEAPAEGQGVVAAGMRRFAVDWHELTDPTAVDRAVSHMVRNADQFLTQRTGQADSVQVMDDIAAALGVPKEKLLGNPRMAQREKEIRATALLADAAHERAEDLSRALVTAPEGDMKVVLREQLKQHLARSGMIYEKLFQYREEMGLGLRAFAGPTQDTLAGASRITELVRSLDAGLLPVDRVADHLAALPEDGQKAAYLRKLFEAGGNAVAMLNDIYMASLLATFQGSAANVISNFLAMESVVAQRFFAAGLSTLSGRATEDAVLATEAAGMLVAQVESWRAALKAAVTTFRTGRSPFGELGEKAALTKTEELAELIKGQGIWGHAMNWYAKVLSSPRRFIGAQDAFFKVMNKQMEVYAQAYREAAIQQARGLLKPEDRKTLIRQMIENPPEAVVARAERFADKQTFNEALSGRLASLQNGMSHPFVKFFIPFFRTPVNIFRYNFEFMPGLGLLVKEQREAFLAGGRSRDLVLAQWGMGTMAIGAAAMLAYSGKLRGRGPSNPQLRREWKKEGPDYSVNIGTEEKPEWVGIQRLGVLAPLFGTVADLATVSGELSADEMSEIATALVVAFSRNWLSQTYTQGAHDILEAIMAENPDEMRPRLMQKIGASLAVPSGVRQIAKGGIPGIFEGDRVHREVYSVLDEMISRTPWGSYLYPHVGLDGKEVLLHPMLGPDFVSPIPIGKGEQADIVSREILRLRLKIGLPSTAIEGPKPPGLGPVAPEHGIALDADQIFRYRKLAGNSLKLRGSMLKTVFPDLDINTGAKLGMWDALSKIIESERYKKLTDPAKGKLIRRVVDHYREAAENILVFGVPEAVGDLVTVDDPEFGKGDPDLQQKYLEKKLERAEALGGPEIRKRVEPLVEGVIQSLGR